MTFKIAKIIPMIFTMGATSIGLLALSSTANALPSCEDQGLSYYENKVNLTTEWQAYLAANLQSNSVINTVAEAFGSQKCASYLNAPPNPRPFMRQFDIVQKGCSFLKPSPVITGSSVDYGGSAGNPGILHQSGCRKVLEQRKIERVVPKAAILSGPG